MAKLELSIAKARLPEHFSQALTRVSSIERIGRVAEAFGTLIRATGLQASIGELCELRSSDRTFSLLAEVVGVQRGQTLLTPLGSLQGISSATEVRAQGGQATIAVGPELLGRIIGPMGQAIDDGPPLHLTYQQALYASSPNPLKRTMITQPLVTGVRAIDAALTVGVGQRIGIFAAAGGGKSTLLGMLARGASSDINVIVLVGERGREVSEFIHDSLGEAGLKRSIIVLATSDRPALERTRAAYVGTAIAEYFRDQGKRVMLLMDSATRYARALRDIGLAIGEPPARRGFPPSVFSDMPKLFERAGNNQYGSITAFYTVLVEDEDSADPVGEEVRSILDGHIVLTRKLAQQYHYPAIDILSSASRVMQRVTPVSHQHAAGMLRKYLAKFNEIEVLLQLGEYKSGQDEDADMAIDRIEGIRELLRQGQDEICPLETTLERMRMLFG
jgi:ATP synthase in type III secretion protein N